MALPPLKVRKFIRRYPPLAALAPGKFHRISRMCAITPQHVSRVIQGERGCSFEVAARIAYAAGVDLNQLYYFIAANPLRKIPNRMTRAERKAAGINKFVKRAKRRQNWRDAIQKRLDRKLPAPKVMIFP